MGVIGVGMMGAGMARCLLRAGYPVRVVANRNRGRVEALVAAGAREAADVGVLAAESDVILTCVSDAAAVETVAQALLPTLRSKTLWIDATTSDPAVTRRLAEAVAARGAVLADAPVTGGPPQAETGELTSLVGCAEADFPAVEAVVGAYSQAVLRFGEVSAGHTAKLLNNLVSQGTMLLLAEAYGLARRHGVAWEPLFAAMSGGAARSGTLEKAVGPALSGDFDGSRFTLANSAKDLRYAAALIPVDERPDDWLASAARRRLERVLDAGHGDCFVSRLLDPKTAGL